MFSGGNAEVKKLVCFHKMKYLKELEKNELEELLATSKAYLILENYENTLFCTN